MAGLLALGCPQSGPHDDAAHGAEGSALRIDMQRYRVDLQPDDHALGGETPLVTVIVFTDYACVPCGQTWRVMKNLVEDYGEDLRVVYRAFSVPGYAGGEQAAEAVLAAGGQGKFWEMHERLFEHAPAFDRPSLRAHAAALGLDVPKFLDDLDTGVHAGPRMRHRRQAIQLGVRALPAMFVNGLYLAGFADEEAWHAVVDEEIRRARDVLAEGTPRSELYRSIMAKASTERVYEPKRADDLRRTLKPADSDEPPLPPDFKEPEGGKRYRIEPGLAPTIGPEDAAVVVVEFTDLACPFCRRAWNDELAALVDARKQDVRFAMRHYPLAIHPTAKGAAVATLAADRQGAFWPFHEQLMKHQGEFSRDVFVAYAEALGLDRAKFLADLDDPELVRRIEADTQEGLAVGVTGTPGFFVNGRYASGYMPGQLAGMIDEELEHVKTLVAEGTPKAEVFTRIMAEAVQPEDFPNR